MPRRFHHSDYQLCTTSWRVLSLEHQYHQPGLDGIGPRDLYPTHWQCTTGCTTAVSNAITVTTASIATPTITGPTELCFRSNVTLTTSYSLQPNESFLWSDNSTGSSLLVTSAGSYSLRVVNSVLSCTSAVSNVITVNVVTCPNTKVFTGFQNSSWLTRSAAKGKRIRSSSEKCSAT